MAQKKKKTSGGSRAAARPSTRALAQPPMVAPAAAMSAIQSAATAAAAARSPGAASAATVARAGALALGSSLSIREVGERAAQFKALIAAGSAEVDASQLESVDTAGLQLLLAVAAAARRRGLTLKLHGAGSLHSDAASALGLADQLAATAEILA
jgi:ABC-type transporter Mla MlaB component